MYQLGDHGYLEDVAIVNENDIWVVGSIYANDSAYNAAHWDGNGWELKRISVDYIGNDVAPDLYSICYIAENDIWALGGYPIHWNGVNWTLYHLSDMGILPGGLSGEIWAEDGESVYFVGRSGRIVHYNGTDFRRLNSHTEVDLVDVWGTADGSHVWASGFLIHNSTTTLLHYDQVSWEKIYEITLGSETIIDDSYSGRIISLWTADHDTIHIMSTSGIYHHPIDGSEGGLFEPLSFQRGPFCIRGNNRNDILIVGEDGMVWHYNGVNWHFYNVLYVPGHRLRSVSIKNDIAVIVGINYSMFPQRDIVVMGERE